MKSGQPRSRSGSKGGRTAGGVNNFLSDGVQGIQITPKAVLVVTLVFVSVVVLLHMYEKLRFGGAAKTT